MDKKSNAYPELKDNEFICPKCGLARNIKTEKSNDGNICIYCYNEEDDEE